MMSTKDEVRIAAAGQAAEWFIANQEPAPGYDQRAAFVAWLKASPTHVEEYLGVTPAHVGVAPAFRGLKVEVAPAIDHLLR